MTSGSARYISALAPVLLGIAFFVTSCGKNTPGNGNGNGTDTTAGNSCPLIREYYSQPNGIAQTWSVIPDHDNHLREVDASNDYGNTTLTGTIGGTGINLQYNGIVSAYNFSDNIFTGKPAQYSWTTSNGIKSSDLLKYDDAGEISQIDQFDATGLPSSTVNLRYKDGNLMQAIYQSQSGSRELTTYQAASYDDHPNPYTGMAGSRYLFYNWEYFTVADIEMGKMYQHCSKNNILGYYLEINGIKNIEMSFTYVYDDRGYPTSADQHYIFRSSESGVVIKDQHYIINYTYNNCN